MNIIDKTAFIMKKKHDGIAICGTGYSINDIKPETWDAIESKYDTFGMNWFCKSRRLTAWYLVREQCASAKRLVVGHKLEDFLDLMGSYEFSCKLVKDMTVHQDNYHHCLHTDTFTGDGYVFKEPTGGCGPKSFKDDVFDIGIHHGKGTIYDALHFAVYMQYQKILFLGIDLYDSRYFYLPWDEPMPLVKDEGRDCNSPHLMSEKTLKIVEKTKNTWPLKMYVQNEKSLLNEVIPIWRGE